jgi:hypothetical protein
MIGVWCVVYNIVERKGIIGRGMVLEGVLVWHLVFYLVLVFFHLQGIFCLGHMLLWRSMCVVVLSNFLIFRV